MNLFYVITKFFKNSRLKFYYFWEFTPYFTDSGMN